MAKQPKLIDAHVHVRFSDWAWHWFPFLRGRADYLRYLKDAGVQRFLAFPSGGQDMRDTNAQMCRLWRRNSDLIVPSVHVEPQRPEESVAEMRKYRARGYVWISEMLAYANGFTYQDAGFETILAAAEELEMIINVHMGKPDEPVFAKFFKRYPKLVFVIAHIADNRQLVIERAAFVAPHKNVCLDLSGSGVDRLGLWEYVIRTVGANRVLWGSDFPINDPAIYVARLKSLRVSAADKQKIQAGNFLRLMKEHAV